MGIALWCDVKDKGHAFDEREAIVVSHADDAQYFCRAHCIPAFVTAFHLARTNGRVGIFLPTLGGAFTVTPDISHPAPPDERGKVQQQADASPSNDGDATEGQTQSAPQAAKSGKARPSRGEPPRGERSRESREMAQAIAGLLEQTPVRATAAPTPANYGGRP
jgi:hypothetical protein